MKPTILLIGGGGHCRSVIDVIEQSESFSIGGIIDVPAMIGTKVLGYDIVGCDADLDRFAQQFEYAVVTIGQIKSPELRIKLFNRLKQLGFKLPSIVSPRAYVSVHARVGEGSVIMHDALINANAVIGSNCIVNSKALIEHDTVVESHCHISTGVILNGGSIVKEGSFVGSNAASKEGAVVESRSFIKAGSIIK